MNLSFYIAKRYLFSKKSHNAINIISGISAAGVAIGTAALVCVLSVFNGFEGLLESMFSNFDPDLKISLVEGKTFHITDSIKQIEKLPEVAYYSEIVEENAMLQVEEKQVPGLVKGVSRDFGKMVDMDQILVGGEYTLNDGAFYLTILGTGLANQLETGPNFFTPLYIYAPKRKARVNLARPDKSFTTERIFVSGVFSIQQAEYDNNYMIVDINFARNLFEYEKDEITGIEINLKDGVDLDDAKDKIQDLLGDKYSIQDQYEQQESFFKIMKVEKWMSYFILSFILLIAVFNVIGSLSMLIIDKKKDIITLCNLGANDQLIRRIFLLEGWLISVLGAFIGLFIGSLLSLLQEWYGFITIPGNSPYVINAYPVELHISDLVLILITVLIMGFLAAYYPVKRIDSVQLKEM